jgi:hypothetical protein
MMVQPLWRVPVILTTQETEKEGSSFEADLGKIVCGKRKRAGGVAQGLALSSNPSTAKKKKI